MTDRGWIYGYADDDGDFLFLSRKEKGKRDPP
jgi:hypothetical protein